MKGISILSLIVLVIATVLAIVFILMVFHYGGIPLPGMGKEVLKDTFCTHLNSLGCGTEYLDEATYATQVSEIKCKQIGKSSCIGGEYATFGEVCEYFGKTLDVKLLAKNILDKEKRFSHR